MDRDRWERVKTIFHAAAELPVGERHGFIVAACDGDYEVESEVVRLLRADQQAGSCIETPLVSYGSASPILQPGDVLCRRFRIVREVGEGGMGHVFEAWDTDLNGRIALKAIRREIVDHPDALKRFLQEARLSREITHPNVCRTFDIERDTRVVDPIRQTSQEVVFLTMEFLEGETLATKLARTGALSLDEARMIAGQIADGLSCAHAKGIVHRDIKPANIMLVAPAEDTSEKVVTPAHPRVVITDFGLARLDPLVRGSDLSALSHSAFPVGTLGYMAPEQLKGATISVATDVYSFGLVLFEMVTGQRAFPSDNLLSGLGQRLGGSPLYPKRFSSGFPAPWRRAIEGCLRTTPSERYQRASDVVAALGGNRIALPAHVRRRSAAQALFSRPLFVLAILIVIVALSFGGMRLYQSRLDAKVAPGALVYLTQVNNETGDKTLDHLTELIQAGLTQSSQINLVDEGRVGDILQQMTKPPRTVIDEPTARELAMRAGAARVIFANVTRAGDDYKLNVDIQQPDNTPARYRDHWTRSFAWRVSGAAGSSTTIPAELLATLRSASDWIRYEAGESANDIARLDVPPENVTTNNWAALQDYAEGEKLARADRREASEAMLERAVSGDPNFALAWGRLGDLLLSLHRDVEGYQAYDRALDAGQQSRLTRKEEDRIRGMRAVDTADYQLAVDAFHDYTVYYPQDYIGWIYPMRPLRMLGRDGEAFSDLRRALSLDPDGTFANYGVAQELILLGRNDEARGWASAHLRNAHPELADRIEIVLDLLNGQYDRAEKVAAESQAAAGPKLRSYGYRIQASLAADRGNYRQAIEYLNLGLDEDTQEKRTEQSRNHCATYGHIPEQDSRNTACAPKLLDRAYVEARLGEFDDCLRDVRDALDGDTSPWTIVTADTVLGAAYQSIPHRYHEPIRRELARMAHMLVGSQGRGAIFEFAKWRTQGEILLAEGKHEAAVEAFRKAALKDAPVENREYLGRALWALAASEKNSTASVSLRRQALEAYSTVALRPALIWCDPGNYLPGFYADQLQSYVYIAQSLGRNDPQASAARDRLARLREPNIR